MKSMRGESFHQHPVLPPLIMQRRPFLVPLESQLSETKSHCSVKIRWLHCSSCEGLT